MFIDHKGLPWSTFINWLRLISWGIDMFCLLKVAASIPFHRIHVIVYLNCLHLYQQNPTIHGSVNVYTTTGSNIRASFPMNQLNALILEPFVFFAVIHTNGFGKGFRICFWVMGVTSKISTVSTTQFKCFILMWHHNVFVETHVVLKNWVSAFGIGSLCVHGTLANRQGLCCEGFGNVRAERVASNRYWSEWLNKINKQNIQSLLVVVMWIFNDLYINSHLLILLAT